MKILILLLAITGCSEDWGYSVMMCPKDSSTCQVSNFRFSSLEECNSFIKTAAIYQPNTGRICVKASRPPGVY